jgi:phosphonate transport system permease protein
MARESFVLTNGKVVIKPRTKIWLYTAIVLVLFFACFLVIPIDFRTIRLAQVSVILEKLFTPAPGKTWGDYFAYMLKLDQPIMETIRMSFAGTTIGAALCLPFAFLCSRNIVKSKWIYQPTRVFMNFLRTLPTLVVVVVVAFFFGFNVFTAIIAISIFTWSIMTKMLYETIETVDMGPFEALEACGGNKTKAFSYAVFPQVMPIYLSYFIYTFEINVRSSVVLGYVGAGGIGVVINENIGIYYDRVGAIIIVLFVLVIAIQLFSSWVRSKLQ